MKRLLIALLVLVAALNVHAQYISPFFTSMPDDILSYLNANNRKDLLDLYQAGKTAKVENLLKGETELKELTDNFLKLQLTSSSSAQIKLLQVNDATKIIAVIETVSGTASDSRIRFYTSAWQIIPNADFISPITLDDFVNKQILAEKNNPDILNPLDVIFLEYSFDKETNDLTVTLDAKNYLNKVDYEKINPVLNPTIKFHWTNGKFTR